MCIRDRGYQIPEAGRTAKGTNIVNILPLEPGETVTAGITVHEFDEDNLMFCLLYTSRAGVKVMLTGYNLETGITVSVDADIQETGACVMPARLFFDIVRKLPDDTVSIQVDESFKVSIKGGISSFTDVYKRQL